jgi:two-component system phosphate regulon sensor histidine kinase PhoR
MLKRIYALIALILLVSVFLTGWIAFKELNDFNKNTNRSRLHSAINYISSEIKSKNSYPEITKSVKEIFSDSQNTIRYTIIDFTGKVIYDNEVDYKNMDNHFFRSEVYNAFKTQSTAYSIRNSDTLKTEIFYLAEYKGDIELIVRASISMADYSKSIGYISVQFVFILGITFLLLSIIAILIANLVTRPLIRLRRAALAMSVGDYGVRVEDINDKSTEVAKVSLAFNSMAEQLQTVFYDLEEKNIQLNSVLDSVGNPVLAVDNDMSVTFINQIARDEFVDPSFPKTGIYPFISIVRNNSAEQMVKKVLIDEVQANSNIEIKTQKGKKLFKVLTSPIISQKGKGAIVTFQDITQLDLLQQMRSEFVANVTHELRTPLTSIRGFVDTLRNGAIRNPEVSERFLEIIDVEAERLHKLISDILILSEIEDVKQDPDITNFDLNALIDEVIVLLDDEASSKKVSLITAIEGEFTQAFPVNANSNRIKQILINLIENAIKYNVDNGKVFISANRNSKDEVEIIVRDTGNGIPGEHIDRVFERFYRVDKGRSKQLGGTGLGLSIVKHIAMLYNGNARVESEIGEGSTFTVTLKI